MRCAACDVALTDFESTIKCVNSGRFLDLCGKCRSYVVTDVDTTEHYESYDPDVDMVEYDTIEETNDGPPESSSKSSDDDGEI